MAERLLDLPDECWELIFDRLDHRHHFDALSLVCKRFLSMTNRIRSSFAVGNANYIVHGTLSRLFHRFHNLKSLDLRLFGGPLGPPMIEIARSRLRLETLDVSTNDRLTAPALRELGRHMSSLRVLNCAHLGTLGDVELIVIAESLPCLEELDISFRNDLIVDPAVRAASSGVRRVTDYGIQVLASKLASLRRIDLSGNPFISDRSVVAISSNCSLLEEIRLLECSFITPKGIRFLMNNSPNLSSISVDKIINQSHFPVVDLCTFPSSLSTLKISDSFVSDGFLRSLAKSGIPLKRFALSSSNDFTFSGILFLLQAYRSLESLTFTDVYFLTDEHMSQLSKYLLNLTAINLKLCSMLTNKTFSTLAKSCPLLEHIDMSYTDLGKGQCNVENVVNPQIRSLNLGYNNSLRDESLGRIASICPSLEQLDLARCPGITKKGISEFLKNGSKLARLHINGCRGIRGIDSGSQLPKLEVLQASSTGIDDAGLAFIGNRCCGLVKLELKYCFKVTESGLKEMLVNCTRLREINLHGRESCDDLSPEFIAWMVFSRRSLRKIIPPYSSNITEGQRKLFLHHGCLVCEDYTERQDVCCR